MTDFNYNLDVSERNLSVREVRMLKCVNRLLSSDTSLRRCCKDASVSKTSLHKFIREKLPSISWEAYLLCDSLLRKNKLERNNFARFPRPEPKYSIGNSLALSRSK